MKYSFIILTLLILSCKSNSDTTTPATPVHGTGLKHNSAADIAAVPAEEFDDSLFISSSSIANLGESFRRTAATALPASFSLDGPPIIDQKETGKCGVFSSAYYIIGMYNGVTSAAQNYDKVGSTDFAYAQYKKISGQSCGGEGGVLVFPTVNGTPGLADILQQYGTCSWNQLPFTETNDCATLTDQLVNQAAVNKISKYRRIEKNDYYNPLEMKSLLYAGFPLWIGIDVDESWKAIKGTTVWSSSTVAAGGHAMTVVGWDDAKQAYKVANSWGTTWGDNGFGWVDYTYLAKLLDNAGDIAILYPSQAQMAVFSNLSPGSCGRAGWGEIVVTNKQSEPVAVEITGANGYVNKKMNPTPAGGTETYAGIPQGAMTVKVYNSTKTTLLNTYNVTVTKCTPSTVTVN